MDSIDPNAHTSSVARGANIPVLPPQVFRTDAAGPQYRIIRRLHDSSPTSALYLCDRLPSHPTMATNPTPVVVKVARCRANPHSRRTDLQARSTPPHLMDVREGGDSIHQEYAVASRLLHADVPHPHVVEYHSVATSAPNQPTPSQRKLRNDNDDELVVLVMEYCPRGDLFTQLEQQQDRCFPEAQALVYFQQIVSGVHYLHTLGIAHLDISLENVLVDAHGDAKICDFGLSTFIDRQRRHCAKGRVGKLQYMAPEVVAGEAYDPVCADVWSLGVVLFILLTGSPLFQLATRSDPAWKALDRVGVSGILRHWKMQSVASEATVELLASMLRLDASRRLQSLDSVVNELSWMDR